MTARIWLILSLAAAVVVATLLSSPAPACCPAPPAGQAVVNADQTVVILWDPVAKVQHFIRQASFKSQAEDFGFLIPTPSEPELNESGNDAFPFLSQLTAPAVQAMPRPSHGMGCKKSESVPAEPPAAVTVLAEKLVAGFQAVVLEATSADALVGWLKEHGYSFSPEVEAWAKPYVLAGWKITALKMAKGKESGDESVDDSDDEIVDAAALRMSFATDRPLFPYREPDPTSAAKALGADKRLLRIFFLADARYRGDTTKDDLWTGKVVWANKLGPGDRIQALGLLKLPDAALPAECWLTEFEDDWRYRVASADVYFTPDSDQSSVERPPITEFGVNLWPTAFIFYIVVFAFAVLLLRRLRRGRRAPSLS